MTVFLRPHLPQNVSIVLVSDVGKLRRELFLIFTVLCLVGIGQLLMRAQESPAPENAAAGSRRLKGIAGKVLSLTPKMLEVKTIEGKTIQVTLTGKTHFRKDRQSVKFSSIKVGDIVFVGGQPVADNAWTADVVAMRSDTNERSMRDALGKVFIVGEIKSIKGTDLVIQRPDGIAQTISVDETTSFRKDDESLTLADFKPGDKVFGRGAVKNNVFVPTELHLGDPRSMMMGSEGGPR